MDKAVAKGTGRGDACFLSPARGGEMRCFLPDTFYISLWTFCVSYFFSPAFERELLTADGSHPISCFHGRRFLCCLQHKNVWLSTKNFISVLSVFLKQWNYHLTKCGKVLRILLQSLTLSTSLFFNANYSLFLYKHKSNTGFLVSLVCFSLLLCVSCYIWETSRYLPVRHTWKEAVQQQMDVKTSRVYFQGFPICGHHSSR